MPEVISWKRIIKNSRGVRKCNAGVNSKEYSIVKKIKKIFPNEIVNEQYRVKKYFIDLFFTVQRLGIEIDENGHMDRSKSEEKKRKNDKRKN